jgi:acyl-CoA synthetase (AMP-forming)/AMP-acid ligase II
MRWGTTGRQVDRGQGGTPVTAPDGFLIEHGLTRRVGAPIPGAPASVAALVSFAAERAPDDLALADRRTRLTYGALRDAVDRAAAVLRASGLRPLDRVGVSLPNTVDVVVAYLAAMRCGLIWVGINTNLAPPEKVFLVRDSDTRVLVAERSSATALADLVPGLRLVEVDADRPGGWWADAEPAPFDPDAIDPHGPAAIAYTSGTTGRPKGVVHSQHNMVLPGAAITAAEPAPLVQGVCLPLTILNMQVLGTVQSLLAGGVCVPMDRIDIMGIAAWLGDFGVQRMYGTPPILYDLLTHDVDPAAVARLTHFGVGGAKTPSALFTQYRERFGREVVTGYGLTEAPTSVTGVLDGDGSPPPIGSAGRARPQLSVTIRNGDEVLGPDQEGEICVGPTDAGRYAACYTTMLGYWNRPDATEAALHGGVLHTGDVGLLDPQGILWVRDRRSELILRGGANVYPAEVERVVESTGLVAEAAVVGRGHPRLGEEVVGFVAPVDGVDLDLASLDAACRAELARYKVPVTWYVVESFPRNAMGKVLKPSLRDWLAAGEPEREDLQVVRHDAGRP